MNRPRSLLFDFGGTLLDVDFSVERAITRMLDLVRTPHNVTLPQMKAAGDELRALMDEIRGISGAEFSLQIFHRHLLDRLGLCSDYSEEALEQETSDASHITALIPNVAEVLAELKQRGLSLGVVSNTSLTGKSIARMLSRFDLPKYFDFIMTSADYGLRKPHPDLFRTASAKLSCPPSEIWFVGDSLEADIAGAKNSGMGAVWFNPAGQPAGDIKPDVEIRSWMELVELIKESRL